MKIDNTWYKVANNVSGMSSGDSYDVVVVGETILFSDMTAASAKDILTVTGVKGSFEAPTLENEVQDLPAQNVYDLDHLLHDDTLLLIDDNR